MQIKVNGPLVMNANEEVSQAMDFWYKTGYSSSGAVFGKKQVPVFQDIMNRTLHCESDDDEKDNDKVSDYKRKLKRQSERNRMLKNIHRNMKQVLEISSQQAGQAEHESNEDDDDVDLDESDFEWIIYFDFFFSYITQKF